MDYYMNPQIVIPSFGVPNAVVDRYFKLAKAEHVKVLIYILRAMTDSLTEEEVAENCGVTVYEVKEALLYWADAEILMPKNVPVAENKPKKGKTVVSKREKPTRQDILKRSLEDPKIQYLMNEAEIKLKRSINENEKRTLAWLYMDEGLDVSVILLVIQYAVSKEKTSIRFIEMVAMDLIEKGIENVADAAEQFQQKDMEDECWLAVCSIFGIKRRKPSERELESSIKWLNVWKISKEMLKLAYDACVDHKSEFSFSYVSKILENWHQEGYNTPEDVKAAAMAKKESGKKDDDYVTYDLNLFEKMLNSKD